MSRNDVQPLSDNESDLLRQIVDRERQQRRERITAEFDAEHAELLARPAQ